MRGSLARRGPALNIGLGTGLAAFVVLGWGLGRPAFWVDESASVVATQRHWSAIFSLLRGAEAPLVPYYLLLKLLTSAADLVPGLDEHREVLYRWPSAVAAALSVGLLGAWLTKRISPRLGLASCTLLLLTAGLSRYGQEARPYAFTMLAAVVSTILWSRLMDAPSRRRGLLYALSVVAVVNAHLLCATVVVAHLVASAWTAPSGRRIGDMRWTAGSAAVGAALVSPFAVLAAAYAHGPGTSLPPTPALIGTTMSRLFTVGEAPLLGFGLLALLVLVGLSRTGWGEDITIARTAVAWAVVPLVVVLPLSLVLPGLLRMRYLVFTLPGWAILAGLGLITVGELARTASARLGTEPQAGRAAGLVAGALVLTLTTWAQVPSLQAVRSPDGHSEDVRPVLALISAGSNAELPVLTSDRTATIVLAAYGFDESGRLVGTHVQRTSRRIWPLREPDSRVAAELRGAPRVLFLQRSTLAACSRKKDERTSVFVRRCLPKQLSDLGYRVLSTRAPGRNWAVAVLGR